jgi:two-component system, chemotaxis family, CheB/CheR fusion protein
VAGIGASAGGLAALKLLLEHLPVKTGVAFVLIQHLPPDHRSMLVELLRPAAKTQVSEALDGTVLEPDHFYVCPARANIAVKDGVIRLIPLTDAQKGHMSIDSFLFSLAQDQQRRAVAVVLSGTGSDGAAGLRAVKNAGGVTFVQDPATAEYDGMPCSAVETGCVDFVLSVPKIADALSRITAITDDEDSEEQAAHSTDESQENTQGILRLLKSTTDIDFNQYKPATIGRRIERRMMLQALDSVDAYADYLRTHPAEMEALANDLLIGVTEFFRDPGAFEALAASVYPALSPGATGDQPVRVWVAGCASGEEAYSVAMSLLEFYRDAPVPHIQIFATDLSAKGIAKARLGIYSPEELHRSLSEERINRFFQRVENGYRINKSIRELCVFARQNILKDPPFARLDLICCRNLLIYLKPAVQERLMSLFHFALRPDGFLLLGKSESVPGTQGFFAALDKTNRIYVRTKTPSTYLTAETSAVGSTPEFAGRPTELAYDETRAELQMEADRILLARYAPSGVVVDENLKVVLYRGYTGAYLEQSPGKPDLNLLAMIRPGILEELEQAFGQARKEQLPARVESLRMRRDTESAEFNLEVIPLGPPDQRATHFLIVFEDVTARGGQARGGGPSAAAGSDDSRELTIARLRRELAHTQAYLQSNMQKHALRDEELTTLNEEILSSNEELQSMNEELEAAKEELQASQEELVTLNEELRSRNEELSRLNEGIRNALQRAEESGAYAGAVVETVRQPLLVLDHELRVQGANAAYHRNFGTTPEQTVGKRIGELDGWWEVPELQTALKQALAEDEPREYQLEDKGKGERSLVFFVRPIRISGRAGPLILLAVDDVTDQQRALEAAGLRRLSAHLQQQLEAERKRIARQVHDDFGQTLTALQYELGMLKNAPEPWGQRVPKLIAGVQGAIQTVRDISRDLRPPLLDQIGLKAAIQWQLETFGERTGVETSLTYDLEVPPSNPDLLTTLVRIVQEAITNIARHAQATLVTVALHESEGCLVLEIADNGVGIDMTKLSDPRSLGVLGMRERCTSHGGQLCFANRGNGTTLTATLPLPAADS